MYRYIYKKMCKINSHRRIWKREDKAAQLWHGAWCSRKMRWASLSFWNLTRSIPCPHSQQRLQPLERTHESGIPKAFVQMFIQCPGIAERYKWVPHGPLYWWASSSQRNRTKKQKRQHFPWKQWLIPAHCVPLSVWYTPQDRGAQCWEPLVGLRQISSWLFTLSQFEWMLQREFWNQLALKFFSNLCD